MIVLLMARTRYVRLAAPVIRAFAAISGAFVAVAVAGGAPASAAGVAACARTPAAETATVAEVIDGETVRLEDGRIARLAGIDAPRRPLELPDDEPWPWADEALAGLAGLVAGRAVGIVPAADAPDRHGRWRVNLYGEDGWLQSALVRAGLARVHWLPGDPRCIFALLETEKAARAAGRGIWAGPDYAVRRAGDPSLLGRDGLYELVQGRVASVGHGGYMVFLDFGRDYRRDFTIMVSPRVADGLASAGLPVDSLKGRRVRVRGMIEASGGPAIRVNDPAEIELLDDDDHTDGTG